MHPEIKEIGYHCRDYFVKQWDRFRIVPWGVLAHSTHLRGAGTYDEATGRARAGHGHPGHRHPRGAGARGEPGLPGPGRGRPDAWAADPDTLVVPQAGEVLFRLR